MEWRAPPERGVPLAPRAMPSLSARRRRARRRRHAPSAATAHGTLRRRERRLVHPRCMPRCGGNLTESHWVSARNAPPTIPIRLVHPRSIVHGTLRGHDSGGWGGGPRPCLRRLERSPSARPPLPAGPLLFSRGLALHSNHFSTQSALLSFSPNQILFFNSLIKSLNLAVTSSTFQLLLIVHAPSSPPT